MWIPKGLAVIRGWRLYEARRLLQEIRYYPLLKSFQSLINKHLNILYLDENAKNVLMPQPMVTFPSSRKLSVVT